MAISAYSHLSTVTSNTGRIPDKLLSATEIAFKYEYQGDFSGSLGGDFGTIALEARFEVRGPDDALLLAWGFKVTYTVVVFAGTFTYYAGTQKVTITAPAPAPATLGDPNGIAEPGGGSGIGLGDLSFQEAFESPIFKVALPVGSTVKIVFHTAGFPALNDISGLQVRTQKGGGWVSGFRHALDGEAFLLHSQGADAAQTRAVGRERTQTTPQTLTDWKPDTAAYTVRGPRHAHQIALYGKGGKTMLRTSVNDGGQWGNEVTLYTGYTPVGVVRKAEGGYVVLLLDKTSKAFMAYGTRAGEWSDPKATTLPVGTTLAQGWLLGETASLDFFWPLSTGGLGHIHSVNDGKVWS